MVEELKLAIKIDDDAIEQSLLKQFSNAEKMADKVVLTFKNINLDDKNIEAKFKEMQKIAGKNPIDLSINDKSIEMLSAISKQLSNIFEIAKGKSIIDSSATVSEINKVTKATENLAKAQKEADKKSNSLSKTDFSTKNKTEAYNQLKQMADVFKNFYGNEEAIHTKAGTDAAYAYYKAYEEALRKGVAESKLQKVTVDVDKNDKFFTVDKLVYDRMNQYDNQLHYGDTSDLTEEIASLEQRLLKFSDAYSKVKANLGEAPITPEIMQNIEEYVRNLEIAEARVKDAYLMGFTKEDISLYKDSADMYLGYAMEDAIEENEKYLGSLKEVQQVAKETDKIIEDIGTDKSNISSDIKDAFQGDIKNTEDSSAAIKEESKALEQVSNSANEASAAKENFAKANKKVKESAESSSDAVKEEVENLKKFSDSELSGMEKDLAKFSARSDGFKIKPDDGHSFDKWKDKISDLNNKIEQYQELVKKARANGGIVYKEDETQITNLKNEIEGLISTMSKVPQSQRGWDDGSARKLAEKINKALEDSPNLAKSAQDSLKAYYNELVSGNPTRPLNEIQNAYLEIIQQQRELGNTGRNWLDIFKDKKIYSFLGQAASMFSFYDLVNATKQGINTVKEFDDGLTKISYTMDMTKSKLNDLGNSVLHMASDMKSSVDDAMSVAQIYANMQTTAEEIQKLSDPTLILTNLSGFDSSTIADDIQAVNQQFDILAEDSMHIADVYDYISRNIAVDYSKGLNSIAEGLQVAGSTANQAGLSFEQTSAIIAKAVEKTRLEGSQVGNGLKTILTRTSKVGKLSDEVDNETLSQASESLKKIGIEVYNLDGSYREFDVIMTELAGKWDDLTDAEKSNISFSLAATRQTNLLSAILSNFSDSMKLAEDATNAEGSALENQQKYMDSFSGHLQSLETEAKIAWINILNSEDLENGVDLLTKLVKVVGQLIDTFGVLPTLMGGAGLFAGFKNIGRPKMFGLICN